MSHDGVGEGGEGGVASSLVYIKWCSLNLWGRRTRRWFPVHTTQSQHPNVYKHKSHLMECESMLFITNHIPHLSGLSNSLSNSIINFYSCKVVSSSDLRMIQIHNRRLICNFEFTSCKQLENVLHFLMSYMKQNRTLQSMQYGLEIIFIQETIRLPDTEYLQFPVQKPLENTTIHGQNKTLVFQW